MQTRNFSYIAGKISVTLVSLSLSACLPAKKTTHSSKKTAFSYASLQSMNVSDLDKLTHQIGEKYSKNPNDKAIALQFSSLLQSRGKTDQSLAVMRRLAISYPNDRQVLASYGKALAAAGQFEIALDAVRRAQTPEYPDWKLLSAEASILDQLDQKEEARKLYKKALDLKPNHPSLLSNLGMSYLLSGDLKTAETFLRKATQQPNYDSRVRQNLALVLGLKGKFEESSDIITGELPPEQAKTNLNALRGILAQKNTWNQIEKEDQESK